MEENGNLNDVFNEGENSQDSEKKSEYSQEGTHSSQLDESSQLSQENESKDEQKDAGEEVEEEKYDDSEINAKNLEILHNDINYGIVLAFIDKFGKHFSFKEIKFGQFEQNIINIRSLNKNLSDIFLNLLRNLSFGRYVRKEKFDYYMTKFTNRFSHDDALEIEKSGYAKLKIQSKVTIIKNLLESQFDENQKLKQIIAEQTPDQNSLRTEPSGKDLNGLWYFVYMDSECSVRVFSINHREMNEDLTSWKLVAKNLNDLKLLVEKLSTEPALEKLRSSKKYQEKYKKEAEQNEHSDASNVQSGIKAETEDIALVKDEDTKEIKIEIKETEAIKEEFKNGDDEKIKEKIKDEPLNEKKEEELEPKSENKMENEPVPSDKQETKIEKIEPEKEIGEENDTKTQENDQNGPEINDELEVEPIALRKSTRSSVRKMQQTDQLKLTPTTKTTAKSTPKSVKKSNKKVPKKKSPKKKNATCVEYIEDELEDEEIEEEDDDEEFAPSPSKKKAPNLAKKKSGHKKKPNLLEYESGSTISDESDQESACVKCQKVKSKQILILCDGCDAPYHIGCLKPPLLEIPEGDWFCQVCAHDQLIRYLEQKISLIEHHNRQVHEASLIEKQSQKRSYTDISTYLDNLFSSNAGRKIKQEKPKKSIFEETVLEGPRSCRLKSRVKYTFEDFDKSINQACGEEAEEEIGEPRPTRATRRSTRLNEHFDSFNSEAESDAGSNSSEYKAKIARPKYKSESEEMSEEEAEESDEDFKSGSKKRRNERANGKKAKSAKKRKTRSKYCDDSESEVEGTEEEEEEARFSDEEVYNQRYSRRKRRVYRELGDDESETISDHENLGNCRAKVRSTRTKSKRRNYCESSDEEGAKEESPKSKIKKVGPNDQEECGDEVPVKKAKPIIKRPWSDEDSAGSKSEKGTAGENGNRNGPQLNGTKSSENEMKSQVVNEAPGQSTVENKPIVLPAQNFVPNTFIATAAPLVYYYCQPTHIQPAPIIQMNGQIQNQMQPIVLMNIPSQSFIKPS